MWRGLTLLAAGEFGAALKRHTVIAVIYGIALFMMLLACGFVLAALHSLLADRYGSVAASLIVAGALFTIALVILLVGLQMRRQARQRTALAATALMMAPALAPTAARALGSRATLGIGIVAGVMALGAVLGRQIGKDH